MVKVMVLGICSYGENASFKLSCTGVGGAVPSWLVHSSPD